MASGLLLIYMIKVSIFMILFYAFNKLLLSSETMHQFNRIFWLLATIFSFVLPLLTWDIFGLEESILFDATLLSGVELTPTVIDNEGYPITTMIVNSMFVLYILGVMAVLSHNVLRYIHLFRFLLSNRGGLNEEHLELIKECESELNINRKINYIISNRCSVPFSWFNYVVLNEDDLKESGKEIIIHELTHISQNHSLDILIINIVTILQWFNPASWLIRREIRQVHEYCADDKVISLGVNISKYQLLLIKKAVGSRLYSISNSLNHSNLKNRITMMTKKKSRRWSIAKCLYILPLTIGTMSVFASSNLNDNLGIISEVKITKNSANTQTEMIDTVDVKPVQFKTIDKANPLYIVDDKEVSVGVANSIDPNQIKSMSVLKGKSAIATYGEKGKNGVVVINLKDGVDSDITSSTKGEVVSVVLSPKGVSIDDVLCIVDGKEVANSELKNIDPERIKSMSVLKDKAAIAPYGDKGKNGVIVINLK